MANDASELEGMERVEFFRRSARALQCLSQIIRDLPNIESPLVPHIGMVMNDIANWFSFGLVDGLSQKQACETLQKVMEYFCVSVLIRRAGNRLS